jgi:predicted TPR repeat methyltransferase
MPQLEQSALKLCEGKVLDIGAAAGCHSLVLQEKGLDVTALEISELCCSVMQKRGIRKVICKDFYRYENDKYDTLLMLMNGIGIAGTIERLDILLKIASSLLNSGGRLLFDSSDIEYLYIEKDGSKWINLNSKYYGELSYSMHYKSIQGKSFPWLFIDFETLAPVARKNGFEPQLFAIGDHYDYLGILKKI